MDSAKDIEKNIESASGAYKAEAQEYLKNHMDKDKYEAIMRTRQGQELPYVAARVFLSESEWQEYLWIADHGSLEGFCESNNV